MSKQIWKTLALGVVAFGAMAGCQSERTLGPLPEDDATTTDITTGEPSAIHPGLGGVFTMTNQVGGNEIVHYRRNRSGDLMEVDRVATGGIGTGGGLGNQSGLTLSKSGRWLLAVNAGSDDVSVFRVRPGKIELTDTEPSGGDLPISVTIHRDLVYVLHGGVPNRLQGFRLTSDGDLVAIAGSERPLSADDTGPAQASFSPDGGVLVVTEKATNLITTYRVKGDGSLSDPSPQASNGMTPFGFAFNRNGDLLVSEAFGGAENASAVSSYDVKGSGALVTIEASVPTDQTAACWLIVTQDRYAYTTNTGSGSLTGYRVSSAGDLSRIDMDGRTGDSGAGSRPIDVAQSRLGRYLYVLEAGTQTIGIFEVGAGGTLTALGEVGGLPMGSNGLAAY